jgi:hypothetical protein
MSDLNLPKPMIRRRPAKMRKASPATFEGVQPSSVTRRSAIFQKSSSKCSRMEERIMNPPERAKTPRDYRSKLGASSNVLSVSSSISHFLRMAKIVLLANPARASWRRIRAVCF